VQSLGVPEVALERLEALAEYQVPLVRPPSLDIYNFVLTGPSTGRCVTLCGVEGLFMHPLRSLGVCFPATHLPTER
jgi:hypothetical protein